MTDARGCSLWHSLLERPPPAQESWVRDPLGARTSCGGVDPGGVVTLGETTNLMASILDILDSLCNLCRVQVSPHATSNDTDPSQMQN